VSDARDRAIPLSRIVEHEGRYPGEALADIATGMGLKRAIRRAKRWPAGP
jgi:hypothetical protein